MRAEPLPVVAPRAWLASVSALLLACGALPLSSCGLENLDAFQVRVPIQDVGAAFEIADATWFEEEQTLFIFYRVDSQQGLGEFSQIELAFRTDNVEQGFQPLDELPAVHRHLAARCGALSICGSYSTPVDLPPRDVRIQLRYHRDSELTLGADVAEHIVLTGPPETNRSAVLYGVFDQTNTRLQWRLRHQFPAIRNEHAQALGLRRQFSIADAKYGALDETTPPFALNPYGYGMFSSCPASFLALNSEEVATDERARFAPEQLPTDSYDDPYVCANSTVTDATGTFTAIAFAQKNPETRPAFPAIESPVREARQLHYMLEVCDVGTTEVHRAMQMQRLFLSEADVVCIDDFDTADFSARLATRFSDRINDSRFVEGDDMVLVIGLNRPDDVAIAVAVEQALALVVPAESAQPSPRLVGAFVFDTEAYSQVFAETTRRVLWCPSGFGGDDLGEINDVSLRSCAVRPVTPIELGSVRLASLPILPTRDQHADFIERYGEGQTGSMEELSFFAPVRTTTSVDVPIAEFGLATFFNEEAITPAPADAFSYCANEDSGLVVFRVPGIPDLFPLAVLGEVHIFAMLPRYELGLFWDFPYLLRMNYQSTLAVAGDVDQLDLTIGFGRSSPAEEFLGAPQWEAESFDISDALVQCTRFCSHPTFDSGAVYNVLEPFAASYASRCYEPRFPRLSDDGFPPDP